MQNLSVIEVLKSDFQHKKEIYDHDKLVINWQNLARVRLQLKFAFIRRSIIYFQYLRCLLFRSLHLQLLERRMNQLKNDVTLKKTKK